MFQRTSSAFCLVKSTVVLCSSSIVTGKQTALVIQQAIADTALKIAQATKEAGEASKKPIELKIGQTNKEIADLEKSLKTQNVEIGANEVVRRPINPKSNME